MNDSNLLIMSSIIKYKYDDNNDDSNIYYTKWIDLSIFIISYIVQYSNAMKMKTKMQILYINTYKCMRIISHTLSFVSRSAPASRRTFTVSVLPQLTAWKSGVIPFWFKHSNWVECKYFKTVSLSALCTITWHHTISYHIIWNWIKSYHIISYHIILYHIVKKNII